MALTRSEIRRLELCGVELARHTRRGQEWVAHWHEEWSFGAIVRGECRCSVGGELLRLRSGDILAIPPRTVHLGLLDTPPEGGEILVVMLYLPPSWLKQEAFALPAGYGKAHAPALARQAAHLTEVAPLRQWLQQALPVLCRKIAPRIETSREVFASPAELALLQAMRLAVLGGEWQVAGVARRCGVSRERLHQVTTRRLGLAPSDYLRTLRLHRAKELLEINPSLAHIAAECGFADQAHFTRWFRKAFGYTPGDWLHGQAVRRGTPGGVVLRPSIPSQSKRTARAASSVLV